VAFSSGTAATLGCNRNRSLGDLGEQHSIYVVSREAVFGGAEVIRCRRVRIRSEIV
jgi:hypothetical protein